MLPSVMGINDDTQKLVFTIYQRTKIEEKSGNIELDDEVKTNLMI